MKSIRVIVGISAFVCIALGFIVNSGLFLRNTTGYDVAHWFHRFPTQNEAYKLHSENLELKSKKCTKLDNNKEITLDSIEKVLEEKKTLSKAQEECLNELMKGPVSAKDDLKKIFDTNSPKKSEASQTYPKVGSANQDTPKVQSVNQSTPTVSQSEPKVFRREPYEPAKHGPSGMTVTGLGNEPFTVRCSGTYSQLFADNLRDTIPCNGIYNSGMSQKGVNSLREKDQGKYGAVLVDRYQGSAIVNLNIPPNLNSYSDIVGKVYIDFLR